MKTFKLQAASFFIGLCLPGNVFAGWDPGPPPTSPHTDSTARPPSLDIPYSGPNPFGSADKDQSSSKDVTVEKDEIAGKCKLKMCFESQIFLTYQGKTLQIANLDSTGEFHFKGLDPHLLYQLQLPSRNDTSSKVLKELRPGKWVEFNE